MKIGVPKEIKSLENRVGMNPGGIKTLVLAGHEIVVEKDAGAGAGLYDEAFIEAGATIVDTAKEAWDADMVIKVKEPLESEYQFFKEGLVLFTYLHLAPLPGLTKALMESKVRAIAYETIEDKSGNLPLLRPMSEVAGRMAVQVGAMSLQKENGGKGLLLGGVPGTRRGRVVILGGGIVGTHAAYIANGMGARVTVLEVNHDRMTMLENIFQRQLETLYSNPATVEEVVSRADLVIGAVLVPGAKAPQLVDENLLKKMENGSVVVDVAVDQGGCITTCRPTTHDNPTYEVEGVVHYCVPNMPGAVAQTSTFALTNVTLAFAKRLAADPVAAIKNDLALFGKGVNCWDGHCTYQAVAEDVGVPYTKLASLL